MVSKISQIFPTKFKSIKSEPPTPPAKVLVITFSKEVSGGERTWARKYFHSKINPFNYLSDKGDYLERVNTILRRAVVMDANFADFFKAYDILKFDQVIIAATREEKQLTRYLDFSHKVLQMGDPSKIFYSEIQGE